MSKFTTYIVLISCLCVGCCKKSEPTFKYNDDIIISAGFHKDRIGTVYDISEWRGRYTYYIKTDDNNHIHVDEECISLDFDKLIQKHRKNTKGD